MDIRETKFRFWDRSENRMTDWDAALNHIKVTDGKAMCFYFGTDEEMIPMQYTRVKDKNGVDIYEGDILRICNGSINGYPWMQKYRVVEFKNASFGVPVWEYDSTHWVEVIGNIYQHPEFLNEPTDKK